MLGSDSQVEAEVSETELGLISGYGYVRFLSWKAGKLLACSMFILAWDPQQSPSQCPDRVQELAQARCLS